MSSLVTGMLLMFVMVCLVGLLLPLLGVLCMVEPWAS
jgi:hypothetical protein